MSMYGRPLTTRSGLRPLPARRRASSGRADIITGVLCLLFLCLLFFSVRGSFSIARPYLILPIFGVVLAVVVPAVIEVLRKGFDPFTPVLYATLSYFIPVFIVGSLYLMFTVADPWYMKFVSKPEESLPLTLVYVAVGLAALSAGYQMAPGKALAARLAHRLPDWRWAPERLVSPAVVLLLVGSAFKVYAFSLGVAGYQMIADAPVEGGLVNYLAMLGNFAAYLLWLAVFRRNLPRSARVALGILLFGFIVFSAVLGGGRASLLSSLMPPAFAFWGAGRRLTAKGYAAIALVAVGALMLGMVYGTTFRFLKGGETKVSVGEYSSLARVAASKVSANNFGENLEFAVYHLMERLEVVSSLAVVVSSYERLHLMEKQYKIDNSIFTSLWAAFVPRFAWKDKPFISDARSVGALYYNFGQNSFALSPMIDLLRNFGPIGVPLGMLLLGIVVSLLYHLFWVPRLDHPWHAAVYSLVLPTVSYEAFYATIVSDLVRILLVAIAGGIFLKLWLSLFGRRAVTRDFWKNTTN